MYGVTKGVTKVTKWLKVAGGRGSSTTDGHGFTGGNRANEEAEMSGQKMRKSQKDGVRKMGTGDFNHGWTRMDTDLQEETEQTERQKVRDRKCEKSQKDGVRKMGAVTKLLL